MSPDDSRSSVHTQACSCSGHRNDPNPCPACEADTHTAESVEDALRLGKLDEELVEWALDNWDGPTGVGQSIWECQSHRAVRDAMQEFLSEHEGVGDQFALWVLETAQIEERQRNPLLDAYKARYGLPVEPDVRVPNAQAKMLIATVEGDEDLREWFLSAEIERRVEDAHD